MKISRHQGYFTPDKEVRKMTLRPFGGRGFYDPYGEMNRLLDELMGSTAGPARRSGRQQGGITEWAPALEDELRHEHDHSHKVFNTTTGDTVSAAHYARL
jgi:hypothetical protein